MWVNIQTSWTIYGIRTKIVMIKPAMSKGFRQEHVISERKNMNMIWLVVYLPLWKIWKSVGMMTFPIEWKVIKFMFQTNQIIYRQKNTRSQECSQSLSLTVLWFPNPSGCHPQIRGATTNASGTGPWWTQTINSIPVAMPKKKTVSRYVQYFRGFIQVWRKGFGLGWWYQLEFRPKCSCKWTT